MLEIAEYDGCRSFFLTCRTRLGSNSMIFVFTHVRAHLHNVYLFVYSCTHALAVALFFLTLELNLSSQAPPPVHFPLMSVEDDGIDESLLDGYIDLRGGDPADEDSTPNKKKKMVRRRLHWLLERRSPPKPTSTNAVFACFGLVSMI